jgi:hypothetical protein
MNEFDDLASRVRKGDRSAATKWQEAFQPQMRRIVRRTIRAGAGAAGFTRRIWQAASKLIVRRQLGPLDDENLVEPLSQRLNETVLHNLQSGASRREIVNDTVADHE